MEKSDLLLLLLYSPGSSGKSNEPITGITRLTKLLYLLKEEAGVDDSFTFEPYKMGPFSSEIYSEIDFLSSFPTPQKALLQVTKQNTQSTVNLEQLKYLEDMVSKEEDVLEENEINMKYELSNTGVIVAKQIWESLPVLIRDKISSIKRKFGSIPLRLLLRYVYDNHPEMTVNSEIIKDVYGQ